MTIRELLASGYNKELADHLLKAYSEIQNNFILKKWKPSELDSGHFVEAARRILDLVLTGRYLPFDKKLPLFTDQELLRYERLAGEDSFRILIPRALRAIYNIRSKRGVAHPAKIDPNEMDATYILYSVKWVLAELARLKSQLSPGEAQKLIDEIIERHIPILWKKDGMEVVLGPIKAKDKILVLLLDESPRKVTDLQRIIEYANASDFTAILKKLRKGSLIHLEPDGNCHITPLGELAAEKLVLLHKQKNLS